MELPFEYKWGDKLDANTRRLVQLARKKVEHQDDFRGLIVGDTGTGKSHLMLWLITMFMAEPSIKCEGLNQDSYANAVAWARDERRNGTAYVPCVYDEANVYGVEALARFNRELARLMGEIRGLNIFHLWATAQPGRLQADFIDETFDFIIFIYTKDAKKPRLFYFISRKGIDRLRVKEGTPAHKARITLELLRRVAHKYATFKGCFKEYDGVLLSDYNSLKDNKMDERVDDFFERFGNQLRTTAQLSRELGVNKMTVTNHFRSLRDANLIVEGDDYYCTGTGANRYTPSGVEKLKESMSKSHSKLKSASKSVTGGVLGPEKLPPLYSRVPKVPGPAGEGEISNNIENIKVD